MNISISLSTGSLSPLESLIAYKGDVYMFVSLFYIDISQGIDFPYKSCCNKNHDL